MVIHNTNISSEEGDSERMIQDIILKLKNLPKNNKEERDNLLEIYNDLISKATSNFIKNVEKNKYDLKKNNK